MSLMVRYGLRIPGFDNYSITPGGIVYNCRGQKIAAAEYKGKNYEGFTRRGKDIHYLLVSFFMKSTESKI